MLVRIMLTLAVLVFLMGCANQDSVEESSRPEEPTPAPPTPTIDPYELMLDLINEARTDAGVPVVVMGDNPATQIHADNSLEHCISSTWSIDGLKDNMRYSLAGGYQATTGNLYGIDFCIQEGQGYSPILSAADEVEWVMSGWMRSPGNREIILRPRQRKANIGLAWDRFNFKAYVQFESDFVEYTALPAITDGILSMEGNTKNGADLQHGDHFRITIAYSPPVQQLTRGQVARTYGVCKPRKVAFLSFESSGTQETTWPPCLTPYSISPESPPPGSADEARELLKEARAKYERLEPMLVTAQVIRMSGYRLGGDLFSFEADLSDVLAMHGPGVYKVNLFAMLDGVVQPISEYSLFYNIPIPTRYGP